MFWEISYNTLSDLPAASCCERPTPTCAPTKSDARAANPATARRTFTTHHRHRRWVRSELQDLLDAGSEILDRGQDRELQVGRRRHEGVLCGDAHNRRVQKGEAVLSDAR
jgi:hypothetical protein